jgi:hypothetical protein
VLTVAGKRPLAVRVASISRLLDLCILSPLPGRSFALAEPPRAGTEVSVRGYPGLTELTTYRGVVLGYRPQEGAYFSPGDDCFGLQVGYMCMYRFNFLAVTARVSKGVSGGPILASGGVIGLTQAVLENGLTVGADTAVLREFIDSELANPSVASKLRGSK